MDNSGFCVCGQTKLPKGVTIIMEKEKCNSTRHVMVDNENCQCGEVQAGMHKTAKELVCTCSRKQDNYALVHEPGCDFLEIQHTALEPRKAIRVTRPIRYDILDPDFLEDLARIADYGAKKYGDFNWQLSCLTGDKGPINHIYKHLGSYRKGEAYDHEELGTRKSIHLAAIAFNAMMEYYWAKKEENETPTATNL